MREKILPLGSVVTLKDGDGTVIGVAVGFFRPMVDDGVEAVGQAVSSVVDSLNPFNWSW